MTTTLTQRINAIAREGARFEESKDPKTALFGRWLTRESEAKRNFLVGNRHLSKLSSASLQDGAVAMFFGPFTAIVQTADEDWPFTDGAFQLRKGERFISYHMDAIEAEGLAEKYRVANEHYAEMYKWITTHPDLNIKYIVGITYPQLARIASTKKFGQEFKTFGLDVSKDVVDTASQLFGELIGGEERFDALSIVYHTPKSLGDVLASKGFLEAGIERNVAE